MVAQSRIMDVSQILTDRVNRSQDPESPEYGGIGGSQIPAITGHDDFGRDALDVYYECTRLPLAAEADQAPPSVDIVRGMHLEDDIADATPLYYPEIRMRRAPLARHPEERWAVVHADRTILKCDEYPDTPPAEIKAPRGIIHRRAIGEGLRKGYVMQAQMTMFVKRKKRLVFLIGNFEEEPPVYAFEVPFSAISAARITKLGRQFWHDHVLPRVAPNPDEWLDSFSDLEIPAGKTTTITREDNPALAVAIQRYRRIKRLEKRLKEQKIPELRRALETMMDMESEPRVYVPGIGKAYLSQRKGRLTFDSKRLEVHRPLDRDKLTNELAEALDWGVERVEAWLSERDVDLEMSIFRRRGQEYRELRTYDDKKKN